MGYSEFSGQKSPDVQAEQLTEQRSIITPNGAVTGEEGDWEVREPGGNVRKLTDEEFQKEYGGEASGDSSTEESVYDAGETGSYGPSDTETSVDRDEPKADSGTPTEDKKSDTESEEKSESDVQSEDDKGKTGDKEESATETPPPVSRPRRR